MDPVTEYFGQSGVNIDFQFAMIFAGLIWVRFLAMVFTVPFIFGKPVPMTARIGISMILAAFAVPLLLPTTPPPITESMFLIFILFLKEAIFGFIIGFVASIVFHGFEAAGHMVDNQRGMAIAQVLIPQLGTQGSLSSQLLFTLAVAVYLALGFHHYFFEAVYRSFIILPVLEFPNISDGWMPLLSMLSKSSGTIFEMSFTIAAPVIIAILLADIIFGIANRMAPQINVWEMSFNVKGYIGVLMLYFMLTLMPQVFMQRFPFVAKFTEEAIQLMSGGEHVPPKVEAGQLPAPLPWINSGKKK